MIMVRVCIHDMSKWLMKSEEEKYRKEVSLLKAQHMI